jgi:hypothetical protein
MRRILVAVPLLLLAALTACSGDGEEGPGVATVGNNASASASPDPSAPAADEEERKRQFTDCMRAEGVEIDDFKTDGGEVAIRADKKETEAAMQKCRQYLPNGGEPPKLSSEDIEKMREYAQCMRENGAPEFPDPDPETGRVEIGSGAAGGLSKDDIRKADEKCQDKLPQIRKGSGK